MSPLSLVLWGLALVVVVALLALVAAIVLAVWESVKKARHNEEMRCRARHPSNKGGRL